MDINHGLNSSQLAAVTARPGPILVLAGPGSGKTRVLTNRVAYLIQEQHIEPWHIMAVTFTNKAAREMAQRIEKMLEGHLRGLTIGTFHAICTRILRQESQNLSGYTAEFVIFDTDDQKQLIKQALEHLNLDEKKFTPQRMLNGIGTAKNELITPQEYQANNYIAEVIRRVYARYQELLIANNGMDFDDLLMNSVRLFDSRPDILQKYQQRYQHLLVDEFQDTNTAQYAFLTRLAAHGNIFVVGDVDQAIYRWRGADFRNIHRFREHYPQAETFLLEQNYRSTQTILDAAMAVIRHNPERVDKKLFTTRKGGQPIVVRELYNESEEASTVVATMQNLRLEGISPGDCAVMYRTNSQSRALEEAFLFAKMPYKLVGATRFYGRREVRDLLAYLRVIHNPADSVSFNRIFNTPPRGIGDKSQEAFFQWAWQHHWQPAEALLHLVADNDIQHPFSGRSLNALLNFGQNLQSWIKYANLLPIGELIDQVLGKIDYRQFLDDNTEEGRERWGNVMELRKVAAEAGEIQLGEFLEHVALVSETDNLEESGNAPTILTLHAAKGLEFPVVFIVGLDDGILPHSRSLNDGDELAEERRLFYVGLTRAKDRLYLFHTFRRMTLNGPESSVPSRFLEDLPAGLTTSHSPNQRRQQTTTRVSSWYGNSPSPAGQNRQFSQPAKAMPAPPPRPQAPPIAKTAETKFKVGQKVRHASFGEGIVLTSKSTGDDEEVTVAFRGVGVKKLTLSFARLEKV